MATKYVLAALAIVFVVLGSVRTLSHGTKANPQARTWLLIGGIFGAVSVWLFSRG